MLALVAALASPAVVQPCTASQLGGSFTVIPGSPGAGNISYLLRLRNRSSKTCFVSGLTQLRLLSKTGRPLPTKVVLLTRPVAGSIALRLLPLLPALLGTLAYILPAEAL